MLLASQKRIGNFKPRGAARVKAKARAASDKAATKAKRPGMSAKHLAAIRQLPCCVTGRMPAGEAHHLKAGTGERGMGKRSTDRWAVPLSHAAHMELEGMGSKNELAWFAARGIEDPLALAEALWAAACNVAAMTRIVVEHRGKR